MPSYEIGMNSVAMTIICPGRKKKKKYRAPCFQALYVSNSVPELSEACQRPSSRQGLLPRLRSRPESLTVSVIFIILRDAYFQTMARL